MDEPSGPTTVDELAGAVWVVPEVVARVVAVAVPTVEWEVELPVTPWNRSRFEWAAAQKTKGKRRYTYRLVADNLRTGNSCVQIVASAIGKDALHSCRHEGVVFAETSVVGSVTAAGRGVCEAAKGTVYVEFLVRSWS